MIGYTIIGGFLGAGKTTLINAMLATATERLAVIVNDIGDVNIDAALIASSGDEGTIELTNGCVCCSVGDSLASTLRDLCLRVLPPERIVLECSGAADPGRAARYGNRAVLDDPSIVVVADATDVRRRAEDRRFAPLIESQLAAAHLTVITKADLLPGSDIERSAAVDELAGWLQSTGADSVIVADAASAGSLLPLLPPPPSPTARPSPERRVDSARPTLLTKTRHFDEAVTVEEIANWLADVDGLVRAKGIVATDTGPQLVQC